MTVRVARELMKFAALICAFVVAFFFTLPISMAWASQTVGVEVEPTVPPPTTTTPPATQAPPTTQTPPASQPATTSTSTPSTTVPTESSLLDELAPSAPPSATTDNSFVKDVKEAAKVTGALVKGIISGKPVAEVARDVLPAPVASVVVPAVRTASTFVFPIGLAGSVLAFLGLQQRVDATDPKLTAAPLAHDDDVVRFQ